MTKPFEHSTSTVDAPHLRESVATLFDVVEVGVRSQRVRVMARDKNERDADAIIRMAVMRRGLDGHFYAAVAAGKYDDDAIYTGDTA